jgi:succinate dehydrogenase/fumarate reductase flavoprotein subunit
VALRWLVLPWILRTGRFPKGARSPREARPSAGAVTAIELSRRLEVAAAAIREALGRQGPDVSRRRVDHPYFGSMSAARAIRLTIVHTRHHLANLT